MIISKKQLGFALPLVILIAVVLIVAGGAGYYFYKIPKGPAKEAGKIEKQLEKYLKERSENPSRETWEKLMLARSELEDLLKELKDPQICEKFRASGERIHCLVSVAKNLKDHSVCEKISLESPSIVGRTQGDCYKGVAVVLKDYSICEKIIRGLPGECHIEVALAIGDPSECEKIPPPGNKDGCYGMMALNQLNFSICERMSVEEYKGSPENKYLWASSKDYCYFGIINKIEDPLKCEEIGPQDKKDICYSQIAIKEEKLSEEEKKEEAKKLINEALLKIEEVKLEKAKPETDVYKLQTLIDKAIENGKKATELDPKNPEILFQMGNIYFEFREIVSGAKEWAIHYYKRALELEPDNSLYQEKLREIQS